MEDLTASAGLSQLTQTLLALETLLLDPVRRANPELIADLFTEDFHEHGSSGRGYTKAEILEVLRLEAQPERKIFIEHFKVTLLGGLAALATYISVVQQTGSPPTRALRSSIWVCREERWQILFHQGTITNSVGTLL